MCQSYRGACFSQRNVYKWAKYEFTVMGLSEKDMEWKDTGSLVNKKFLTLWLEKNVILTVFWDMKEPITIDFLQKVQL